MTAHTLRPGRGPWNKREFLAAMRRAGWIRLPGPNPIYQSPHDEGLLFHVDRYDVARHGWAWELYAVRHETPPTRRAR